MKRALGLAFLLAACSSSGRPSTPPVEEPQKEQVAAPATGTVQTGTFQSAALGVEKSYRVYLPAGYDADTARRYPVIYMLHGLGGDETNWIEQGKLADAADSMGLPAIVVMPDGDIGFYVNGLVQPDRDACLRTAPPFSPGEEPEAFCVTRWSYEDYITQDLIAHVDATYRTIADRKGRGIGGLSMGGFGALTLAMRHQDLFSATASHSGANSLLYDGPHPYAAGKATFLDVIDTKGKQLNPLVQLVVSIFGTDIANWRAHDPAMLAAKLADGDLAIYLDCGTDDEFQFQDQTAYLHDLLVERGVTHEYFEGPGHHDFAFWTDRIDDSLAFFAKAFGRP